MPTYIALNASLMPHGLEKGLAFTVKAAYADAIARCGAVPLVLPLLEDRESLHQALEGVQGLLLIGGDDINASRYGQSNSPLAVNLLPRREDFDFAALSLAAEMNKPVLGICLGCQVINVHYGGTLYQDLRAENSDSPVRHSRKSPAGFVRHEVSILGNTRLSEICGASALDANSGHHQAIKRLGEGLVASAVASDGIIEAIEDPACRFMVGIQWHPEVLLNEKRHAAIFEAFVDAAAEQRQI